MNSSMLKSTSVESRAQAQLWDVPPLLSRMSVREKIGQLRQVDAGGEDFPSAVAELVRQGRVGSIINQTNPEFIAQLQRIAREESPRGIPLLVARDVIHGFQTIFPIPLGQAASWNPELVEDAARLSAAEAAQTGVNWTFAPMLDISRDPRWGRIAESFGEDPHLTTVMGQAMVRGFQGTSLQDASSVAACAKHFVGYGASEAGRDYNTTNIPPNELHNIYLPPFRGAVDAGVASIMTSFSDIDGIPATAHSHLLGDTLRGAWGYDGVVISDWNAIAELCIHGLCANEREAASAAVAAGVDIEMASTTYEDHLEELLASGVLSIDDIDAMVARVLGLKSKLGLLGATPQLRGPDPLTAPATSAMNTVARQLATESAVLLKNEDGVLPLDIKGLRRIAVIGPLADAPYEQMGTWVFDGEEQRSITPLAALREAAGTSVDIVFERGVQNSRDRSTDGFDRARDASREADVVLVFVGEESILSGEAHSRANIDLPGAQSALIEALGTTGKPVIAVVMSGRPLTVTSVLPHLRGLILAPHGGTMAGPALIDIITGVVSPSGRLPVSVPRSVGQIPIYYNHKRTGRPPNRETSVLIDDIEEGARQTSLGMTAYHLDDGFEPLFPFGFGLTYGRVEYGGTSVSTHTLSEGGRVEISCEIRNTGPRSLVEIVQLYVQDCFGSITRPVKELKAFRRVSLEPGQRMTVQFALSMDDLAFYNRHGTHAAEPGQFRAGIGPDSTVELTAEFSLES